MNEFSRSELELILGCTLSLGAVKKDTDFKSSFLFAFIGCKKLALSGFF